ncbi:rhomboid family intramembrane serine protease [Allokutzneria sp. NRRL B-24872]|uniref:rhomboid family intramembrane serine protease n=1 Tax=Allokutzneria sp. NRRL B-24872 TaxID=1137961 RepID=UPI000A3AF8F6|nr:rhomboid family intramembrane serine protease [Allokutzneria sp. NRRL B-24872]
MTVPPSPPTGPDGGQPALPGCVRHPDRPTGLRCTRCERPACPECLREASVGYQCVDCVREGNRDVRRPVTVAGAELVSKPIVAPVLIALNVVVFVITAVQSGSIMTNYDGSDLFLDWFMRPVLVATDEWWRLVTNGFLHDGVAHLGVNMLALWFLGRDLELLLGRGRFIASYVLSLLGGSVAIMLFDSPMTAAVGASGAIYGLLGGLLVAVLKLKLNIGPVLGVIALNVAITFSVPNISFLAHAGGFVVGAALMAAMLYAPAKQRRLWQLGAFAATTVVLAGLTLYRYNELQALLLGG